MIHVNKRIDVIVIVLYLVTLSFLYGIELEKCDGRNDIYLINTQVVQVYPNRDWPAQRIIAGCEYEDTIEPPPFNPRVYDVVILRVENTTWPPLWLESRLRDVYLDNVKPIGGWGACHQLSMLVVSNCNLSMTSPDWLINCTKLQYISIQESSLSQIRAVLERAERAKNVVRIGISNIKDIVRIVEYPLFTNSLQSTTITLYVSNNDRTNQMVEDMNTSWAEVSAALVLQLSQLPRLRRLMITMEKFDMCAQGNFSSVTFKSLQELYLEETNTRRVCFHQYRVIPHLGYGLFASHMNIEFNELFSTPKQLTVQTGNDNVLLFSRSDYLTLSAIDQGLNKGSVDLNGEISFDCNNCSGETFWLARAIHMGLINAPKITCTNGTRLVDLHCERIECERVACEGACVCCRGRRGALLADCRDARLAALPTALLRLGNVTELLAPNNYISSLPQSLPDNLLWLDLSGNGILINASVASVLFAVPARRLRLAGNPVDCACDNRPLLEAILYYNQIHDIEELKCTNETETLTALSLNCEVNTTVAKVKQTYENDKQLASDREASMITALAVTAVLAVVALVTGVVIYYRRTIQIILFARGWCLCWLENDDLDEDHRYDVFLSFCHEDAELVLDQLLPTLDENYSVCVHLRDWIPGDMIPAHIRRSVQESRKTLVVLSKHFAKSLWGLMEFQTAYASGLNKRRIRVVMVVLDDVLEWPDLNKDFRQYVQFNTYVRWDDPWFWSKLRYALPHKTVTSHPAPQANRPARYNVPALQDAAHHQVLSPEALPRRDSSPDETQPERRSVSSTVPALHAGTAPREVQSLESLQPRISLPDETV